MKIRSIQDISTSIRGRRADLGLSQAELAGRAGVSRKWVYEFEAGKSTAELGLLLRVLDALELDLELDVRGGAPDHGTAIDLDTLLEGYDDGR